MGWAALRVRGRPLRFAMRLETRRAKGRTHVRFYICAIQSANRWRCTQAGASSHSRSGSRRRLQASELILQRSRRARGRPVRLGLPAFEKRFPSQPEHHRNRDNHDEKNQSQQARHQATPYPRLNRTEPAVPGSEPLRKRHADPQRQRHPEKADEGSHRHPSGPAHHPHDGERRDQRRADPESFAQ